MTQVEIAITTKKQAAIVAALALCMLLASLGTSIANIALPALAAAFAAPFSQVQAIVTVYLSALTISVLAAGRLGDRWGLKTMLMVGLGLFVAASMLCSLAPGLWFLSAARALQGVGAAFLMTLSMALMRQTAGKDRIGRAMGLLGTTSALGTAIGPSVGGVLIAWAGWRSIFWVQLPIACLALLLIFILLPADLRGRSEAQVGQRSALAGRLAPWLLVNLLVAAVMMTTLVVGPFYLGIVLGLKTTEVGFVMAIGPAISILCGVPSGHLVDGWGARRALGMGLILLAAGAFMLAYLPNRMGIIGYALSVMILTPGYQLFQAANNTSVLRDAGPG
ncbi:MFS transporter [Klebsiella sp. WOUb02]|uniref:MFS transporter n=1 Tax=Klebsiella sp. WOUb02 TaxID=3161071 RepID=UPI003CFAF0A1